MKRKVEIVIKEDTMWLAKRNTHLPHYRDLVQLLQSAGVRGPAPLIEVHRVCYVGSGRSRQILNSSEIEENFRNQLLRITQAAGLVVEVFIWDDFHDRYLVSDLVGISLPNGFDTTQLLRRTP